MDDLAGRRLQAAITAARGQRTVSQLARDAGVLRQTLYKWFSGGTPSLPELRSVARVLGIPLASLVAAWDGPSAPDESGMTDDLSPATRAVLERLDGRLEAVEATLELLAEVLGAARSPDGPARGSSAESHRS